MHVHTIKVSFVREKQPRDYEKSGPAIELSATLEEGADHEAAARELMKTACTTAYAALGIDIPEKIAEKLDAGETPAGGSTKAKRNTKAKSAKKAAAPKKADASDVPDEDTKPAKEAAKEEKPAGKAADSAADIPDDTPAKSEDKPAVADASDVPDEPSGDGGDAGGDGELSAEELQSFITNQVSSKKAKVAEVKEILAKYNASRTSDVAPEDRAKVQAEIELLG